MGYRVVELAAGVAIDTPLSTYGKRNDLPFSTSQPAGSRLFWEALVDYLTRIPDKPDEEVANLAFRQTHGRTLRAALRQHHASPTYRTDEKTWYYAP